MIDHYEFGLIVVDGKRYTSDLILLPNKIIPSWWRKEGHRLCLQDLQEILAEEVQALVIGTGFFGLMKILPEVSQAARTRGIVLVAEKTARAVQVFNEFSTEKKTAGAFHLTC